MVETAVLLLLIFLGLVILRVPIAYALIFASTVFFITNDRLEPWSVLQQIFRGVDSFVLLAVPFFILAGYIMNEAKVTDKLIALANALVGFVRGGLAMVNVVVSMMFAGISGSSTADTAGVGSVLIPQMVKRGYTTDFSVAVTAASSVLGTIIPPSILIVVWGSLTGTSIGALFLGGVIPGILIGLGMMVLVYILARKHNYPKEERLPFKELWNAFWKSFPSLLIPVFIIGAIVLGIATPTEAAVVAVAYTLLLGLGVYRTIKVKDLPKIFLEGGRLATVVLFAVAAASSLSYLLAYLKIPTVLEGVLGQIPTWLIIPVIILIWIILGTFLDSLPAITIMIPILAPFVSAAGLDPVHYGIISVVALSFGLVTPPYGLCLLLAAKIGNIPVVKALKMTGLFLLSMILVLLIIAYVPQTVTLLPKLFGY